MGNWNVFKRTKEKKKREKEKEKKTVVEKILGIQIRDVT